MKGWDNRFPPLRMLELGAGGLGGEGRYKIGKLNPIGCLRQEMNVIPVVTGVGCAGCGNLSLLGEEKQQLT